MCMQVKKIEPSGLARLSVNIESLESFESLAEEWQALEAEAENTFFLSWTWVSSWLAVYRAKVDVCRVYQGRRLVGLGLLLDQSVDSRFPWKTHSVWLNQTGEKAKDQIWPEYNGLLTLKGYESEVSHAVIAFLLDSGRLRDELNTGVITSQQAEDFEHPALLKRVEWQGPSYLIDLQALRREGQEYLSSLSKNTRYQINRTRRLIEDVDTLGATKAESTEQALSWFDDIAPLHIARWGDDSGYKNPEFVRFHHALIKNGSPQGQVEVFSMSSAGHVLGYLYNFIYKGRLYFYLSGLAVDGQNGLAPGDNKFKPGLLIQALRVQQALDEGLEYYDFMGGEARYKKSLASYSGDFMILRLQKKNAKSYIESFARMVKKRLPSAVD
jgi:CelD/BcsL family acetyltransferase involved in cellulose biosynthesis